MVMYDISSHPLLTADSRFQKLKTPEEKTAHNEIAEDLLRLVPPAYEDDAAVSISNAVALQVAYQLERGYTPEIVRSQSRNHPGDATVYRDRFLNSAAAAIVAQVTKTVTVGFTAMIRGT